MSRDIFKALYEEQKAAIEKEYAKQKGKKMISVQNFGVDKIEKPKSPTKRPSTDFLLGGGTPSSGYGILAGQKSSGKTTWALQTTAESYPDEPIAYIDTEYTTTTSYISGLDLDPYQFIRYRFDSLEDIFDGLYNFIIPKHRAIIWDSFSNASSEEELAKMAAERTRATAAIVGSTQWKKLAGALEYYNSWMWSISHVSQNQERMNKYDELYKITGGERYHHNSSLTIMMTPYKPKKEERAEDAMTGLEAGFAKRILMVTEKSKVGTPYRKIKPLFRFDGGFTIVDDVLDSAINLGILTKKGSWYSYGETNIGQGKDSALEFLQDNPELVDEIYEKVSATYLDNANEHTVEDISKEFEENFNQNE